MSHTSAELNHPQRADRDNPAAKERKTILIPLGLITVAFITLAQFAPITHGAPSRDTIPPTPIGEPTPPPRPEQAYDPETIRNELLKMFPDTKKVQVEFTNLAGQPDSVEVTELTGSYAGYVTNRYGKLGMAFSIKIAHPTSFYTLPVAEGLNGPVTHTFPDYVTNLNVQKIDGDGQYQLDISNLPEYPELPPENPVTVTIVLPSEHAWLEQVANQEIAGIQALQADESVQLAPGLTTFTFPLTLRADSKLCFRIHAEQIAEYMAEAEHVSDQQATLTAGESAQVEIAESLYTLSAVEGAHTQQNVTVRVYTLRGFTVVEFVSDDPAALFQLSPSEGAAGASAVNQTAEFEMLYTYSLVNNQFVLDQSGKSVRIQSGKPRIISQQPLENASFPPFDPSELNEHLFLPSLYR